MSIELGEIPGKIELVHEKKTSYIDTELALTSFYGGTNRGSSVQFTFRNVDGNYSHVQVAEKDILPLIKKLLQCL